MENNVMEQVYCHLNAYINENGFKLDNVSIDNLSIKEKQLYDIYNKNPFLFLYKLAYEDLQKTTLSLSFLQQISKKYLNKILNDPQLPFLGTALYVNFNNDDINNILTNIPYIIGANWINSEWINNIVDKLNAIYLAEVEQSKLTPYNYFAKQPDISVMPSRIYFHLVENKDQSNYPFAFLATYTTIANEKIVHYPLNNALKELQGQTNKLSALIYSISQASTHSTFISNLVNNGSIFSPLRFTENEALTFLTETELYENCGIVCRIPKWYTDNTCKIQIDPNERRQFQASYFSPRSIAYYVPQMIYHGIAITEKEANALLEKKEGLQNIKGKWTILDHQQLIELLNEFNSLSKDGTSLIDILKNKAGVSKKNKTRYIDIEFTRKDWLDNILGVDTNSNSNITIPENFVHILRPYQQEAFYWLYKMQKMRLGTCLADDMGLGKTIEVLCFLEKYKQEGGQKILIIVPATLLENWKSEINRFAPDMSYYILHGKNQPEDGYCKAFLTITTYQTARISEYLNSINWDIIILDEAQAIKNYYTAQTKKIKSLSSKTRIALTGTPIENNILELWSLFDFLNPGLLGSHTEFQLYNQRLLQNPQKYKKLKELISPFILRRLKTDKSVISDLPDKVEIDKIINLTKEQIILYQKTVDEMSELIANSNTRSQRSVIIITTLTRLKQICNHPSQYYGLDEYEPEKSGKFIELKNICSTIYEKREKVLIFTQFK